MSELQASLNGGSWPTVTETETGLELVTSEPAPVPATVETPEPGIYHDVPAATYFSWKAASNSALTILKKSAAHLFHERQHPRKPTEAMKFGTAVHYALLEPETFNAQYIVCPKVDRRTKAGKDIWADFEANAGGRIPLTAQENEALLRIQESVSNHVAASGLLKNLTWKEASCVWKDDESELTCKARVDGFIGNLGCIVDIKTTNDAGEDFKKSIFNFGYHRQAAFYMQALQNHPDNFCFITVEKEPPYPVAVYRLTNDAVEFGRNELRQLLALYARCEETGVWPGYPQLVQDIGLPAWAKPYEPKHIEEL